jgi:hypothetical protein
LLIGETRRDSILNLGLYIFCFANPGSITYTIPSIVREVSAIFVATTHFLPGTPLLFLGGAGSKILCYYAGGSVEYNGTTSILPTSSPSFFTSLVISLQACSISSSPVKNSKISPSSSMACI